MTDISAPVSDLPDDVPETYETAFFDLLGEGYAPASVIAGIEYATTDLTQTRVAERHGVSVVTVRAARDALREGGYITMRKPRTCREYIEDIASILNWELGTEYNIRADGTAHFNKAGIKDLYEHVEVDHD